jgi:hypothetical protein
MKGTPFAIVPLFTYINSVNAVLDTKRIRKGAFMAVLVT